jgi:hypothetical protein
MTNAFDYIQQKLLHSNAMNMAYDIIPEMLIQTQMIFLTGYINDKPVKILLDTGASISIIFESTIKRLNIINLVDTTEQNQLNGIGKEMSIGRIWYIELNLNQNFYPISLVASSNTNTNFDIILGINFLQSYCAQINFKKKIIILNDTYIISFK